MTFSVDDAVLEKSWEHWTSETSPAERITATTLMDAEAGDVYEPEWLAFDVTVEITAVYDGRAHRRVYAMIDEAGTKTRTKFLVVRDKYVFAFAAESGKDFLITADWSDDGIDALLRPTDKVRPPDDVTP